jgi:hypothetical protein
MEKQIKYCECGCGAEVKNRFVHGHHARVNNPMSNPVSLAKLRATMKAPELRAKRSKALTGRNVSPETRAKLSKSLMGRDAPWTHGDKNPMANPEVRKVYDIACAEKDYQTIVEKQKQTVMERYGVDNFSKTSQFREAFSGKNHPGWKGGISPERQDFYNSQEWKDACCVVWGRDASTCKRCGVTQEKNGDGSFHIHHIISFAVEELRAEPSNMILFCDKCHYWVHSNENVNNDFIGEIQ